MRDLSAACLALACLLTAAVPVSAQTSAAGLEPLALLEDPVDDLAVAGALPLPGPAGAAVDLRGLTLSDDEETVRFQLSVGEVGEIVYEHPAEYRVSFRHGEVRYTVEFGQRSTVGTYYDAYLYRFSEALQADTWVAWSQAEADPSTDTLVASFDKADLVDQHGAAPFPTRALEGFSVVAMMNVLGGTLVTQQADRMPDEGEGAAPYPIRSGPVQAGGLSLWTDRPFRSSNGEATTYVYTVQASNQGAAATVRLSAEGVPSGWEVRFPKERVDLAAGATLPLQVLATVPFTHVHGLQPSFLVRLADEDDAARSGQVRLGVDYPEVPQPAGHHPDLVFHSRQYNNGVMTTPNGFLQSGNLGYAWMTTLEEDESDDGYAVPGRFSQPDPSTVRYAWYVYVPEMSIGLDFDPSRPVLLDVPLSTSLPLPGAALKADLYYSWRTADGGWDSTRIVTLASEALDLEAGTRHAFQLEGLPTAESDRLPPHREAYLGWSIVLTAARPGADAGGQAVRLEPGGTTRLPLVDYHDAVDEVYAAIGDVRLAPAGPGTRDVNPGETVLFNLTLANSGEGGSFHLALGGEHAGWARVLGGDRVEVPAGEERTVRLAVAAPPEAADGQALDLLVEAHGPNGATALLRLGGQVVHGADLADEAALAGDLDAGRESPSPAAALLALGLAALAAALRRGR